MNQKKTYSLSEAAKSVGVPRTTINDWISKHANYLHFELKGKRKVLDDSGIEVLKEINELRNSGLSSPEIERKLAENHPVKADQVTENDSAKTPSDTSESTEYAVIVKRQTDELGSLLGEHLQNLAVRLEDAEVAQKNFSKRMIRSVVMTVLVMLLLPIMLIVFASAVYRSLQHQNKNLGAELKNSSETAQKYQIENFKLLENLKADSEKIKAKEQEISRVSNMLDSRDKDYKRNVNKLKSELASQKEAFETMLKKLSKDVATRKQAEIARLRDEFAAKQHEQLKKLQKLQQELEKREKLVTQLSNASETQSEIIKNQAETLKKVLDLKKTKPVPPVEKASAATKK
jgi:DNA repair exonuclease SbcCD ATPase subunit